MFVYLSKIFPTLVYPAGLLMILLLVGLVLCRSAKAKNRLMMVVLLFVLICGNKYPGSFLIRRL